LLKHSLNKEILTANSQVGDYALSAKSSQGIFVDVIEAPGSLVYAEGG
jgi:hypothetical protein